MAEFASKFNIEYLIQYYSDQCIIRASDEYVALSYF